jgi:hypothetical protein
MASYKTKELAQKKSIEFGKSSIDELNFFSKPASLIAMSLTLSIAVGALKTLIKNKIGNNTDINIDDNKQLLNFLKSDAYSKLILSYANSLQDDSLLSLSLLACESGDNAEDSIWNLPTDNDTDIDDKIKKYQSFIDDLFAKFDKLSMILPSILLVYYILSEISNLINNFYFPSIHRSIYVQKLSILSIGMLVSFGDEFNNILTPFKKIDGMFAGVLLASSVYALNRNKLQKKSLSTINEISCLSGSSTNPTGVKNEADSPYLNDQNILDAISNINCDINDDEIVPHQPFEEKLANFSCDVEQPAELQTPELNAVTNLATKAKIVKIGDKKLYPKVNNGSNVNIGQLIATIGKYDVYSPVSGVVINSSLNVITVANIDEDEDLLSSSISLLNEKYNELNNTKSFIKKYEIPSLYPIMLAYSADLDPSNASKAKNKGMYDQYKEIRSLWNNSNATYEKNIKTITSKNNVKLHGENETTYLIKEQIDKEESNISSMLKKLKFTAEVTSKITSIKKNEYELIEYYLYDIGTTLNIVDSSVSAIEQSYKDTVNSFITKRFIIDAYKPKNIEDKINDYIDELEKGITTGDWFAKGIEIYNKRKQLNDVKVWLRSLGDKNNKFKNKLSEKIALVNKTTFLYQFYISAKTYTQSSATNNKQEVIKEANYIKQYFNYLHNRLESLPKEIKDIEKTIERLSQFSSYCIIEENNEQFRQYTITDEMVDGVKYGSLCKKSQDAGMPEEDDTDMGSMKYWLKYCGLATLTGCAPAFWSTGLILPTGPLLLPVVYIPVKPISTPYGFIVIGLTITGIWLFPFVLMVNLSSEYSLPALDPTILIKKSINEQKIKISNSLKTTKKELLKSYLNKVYTQLDELKSELNQVKADERNHDLSKPSKKSMLNKEYINSYATWLENKILYKNLKLNIKTKIWTTEQKYKSVYDAYKYNSALKKPSIPDPGIESIETLEKSTNEMFASLDVLIDKQNKILSTLPIALKPTSSNFGFTIKNPTPVIKMAENLEDNVNSNALDKAFSPFKLNNEDLMDSNYDAVMDKSVLNFKNYSTAINAQVIASSFSGNNSIITQDPFPSYKKLTLGNLQWLKFLTTNFLPTGAQTYGIPGQLPAPM